MIQPRQETRSALIWPRGLQPLFLLLFFLLINGCAKAPLDRMELDTLPEFTDDLELKGLLTGAVRHLHYLNKIPPQTSVSLGSDRYPVSWLRESMESFIDILKQEPTPAELNRIVLENFTVYRAGGREDRPRGEMLITGYYEPFLQGSLEKKAPFLYPLYGPPDSLIQVRDQKSGKSLSRRRDKTGKLVPYWTRKEIEIYNLAAGHELVYLKDPVDAFILHIQGSGKIQLQDGSIRSIHYSTSNGLEYFSIGKLLVDQKKMSLQETNIPAIRHYLRTHPDEQEAILHHNSRFIFFRWEQGGDPIGSLGEPLTGGRSIAIDRAVLPHEALAFLISRKPVLTDSGEIDRWVPLHRFVFPQDTGSAIQGSGRVDLYYGSGNYAKQAAEHMKEVGTLYFLVKNNFEDPED
ncbi:MAG: MltA domain-containing protein [Proteobacteria bacterium]|nr:MltA domain-containing protein [Pseudomonadota bacterium]MBU1057332.1 MltA domain-containing protein [Pseudomonadota bacterium]